MLLIDIGKIRGREQRLGPMEDTGLSLEDFTSRMFSKQFSKQLFSLA